LFDRIYVCTGLRPQRRRGGRRERTGRRHAAPLAPTNVTAVAGTSSIIMSRTPPGTTTGITWYTATASPGPPTGTTRVLGATAGTAYTVTVVANSATGQSVPAGPAQRSPDGTALTGDPTGRHGHARH